MPELPELANVDAWVTGDSVSLSVEPVEGARDYRVYVLPNDEDVTVADDGFVSIQNAIYRCGGDRQAPGMVTDNAELRQGEALKTLVDDVDVEGYTRTLAEATLGYVYVTPGEGRIPVYALGDADSNADNSACFHQRWGSSRVKSYITSEAERDELLAARWRDDGIAFYVPAEAGSDTQPVYALRLDRSQLYYTDGAEADARDEGELAFNVLSEANGTDTVPLMRAYYLNGCGDHHDELSAGVPRFERARFQGDTQPMFDLHWSGITEETTLVIEALDQGCPFVDVLAPISRDPGTEDNVDYPRFLTLAQAQAESASGEVFINGQHDAANRPRALARSFVRVSPGPLPDLDWFAGFGPEETTSDVNIEDWDEPCDDPDNPGCLAEYRKISDFGDVAFSSTAANRFGLANVLGELWIMYADVAADVGGKFRFTPNPFATVTADAYLHVTMEVDAFTTTRRYPQIIISDAERPVQWHLEDANTVVIQTFSDDGTANWPYSYQLEVCDHRRWDVNDQCPAVNLYRLPDDLGLAANAEVGEHTGVDRSTQFDVYLSTQRAYLFLDGEPYGCVDLPSSGVPEGEVSVTFGDVLYHSGVDAVFTFHENHQQVLGKRHFDNLGFKSGVEGPAWNESRFPCVQGPAL